MRQILKTFLSVTLIGLAIAFGCLAQNLPRGLKKVSSRVELENDITSYQYAVKKMPPDYETAYRLRERILFQILAEIDANYDQFVRKLKKGRLFSSYKPPSSLEDVLKPAVLSVKTLTSGKRSQNIVGNSLMAFNLDKSTKFNQKVIYFQVMELCRTKDLIKILKNLDSTVIEYPLEAVYLDLVNYFFAGTVEGAALKLSEIVREQEEVLIDLRNVKKIKTFERKTKNEP